MRTIQLTAEVREAKREEIKVAKSNFKALRDRNPLKFDQDYNEVMVAFRDSEIPVWGSLIFNGVRV